MIKKFNRKFLLIIALVIIIDFAIYWGHPKTTENFVFLRHLFYFPIFLGGIFYGLSGGILIGIVSAFSFAPFLLIEIEKNGISFKGIEYFITLLILIAIGIISGLLSQKKHYIQKFYQSLYDIEKISTQENDISKILEKMNEIFEAKVSFFIKKENERFFVISKKEKDPKIEETRNVVLTPENFIAKLVQERKDFISNNIWHDQGIALPNGNENINIESICYLPLAYKNELLGILAFAKESKISQEDFNIFKTITKNIASNIYNQKLYDFTITDSLTGAYNRRFFDYKLSKYISLPSANNPLSVLMLDIDFFKKINDRYGHQKGDLVLKKVVEIIRNNVPHEEAFRIGGEEFIVLLPNTTGEQAHQIAERIRVSCQKHKFYFLPANHSVTLSIGISCCPSDTSEKELLIEFSDKALYKAKNTGRNKTCFYEK